MNAARFSTSSVTIGFLFWFPGRRTIFRKKFLYNLKEEDSSFINSCLSTSDSKHSAFCPNGNNNNNQGLLFYPCSCMSSLGLPPQSVSHDTFLPTTEGSKEPIALKEVKVDRGMTLPDVCTTYESEE